ncbi:Uncharacterized protein Fot_43824 [Forsythia ovata]|uniref:Uncharacterized protein n=1 Tax=Forsythia ovata TaxID=205694 RepID=A0ABD1R1R6_9LAMI
MLPPPIITIFFTTSLTIRRSRKLSSTSATSRNGFASAEYDDGGYGWNCRYPKVRGRGRGRSFHGRGREGYNGLQATVKATIKNHPFEVEIVAVGGELAAGVVDSRLMGQSMLQLELLRYSNLEQRGHNIL